MEWLKNNWKLALTALVAALLAANGVLGWVPDGIAAQLVAVLAALGVGVVHGQTQAAHQRIDGIMRSPDGEVRYD